MGQGHVDSFSARSGIRQSTSVPQLRASPPRKAPIHIRPIKQIPTVTSPEPTEHQILHSSTARLREWEQGRRPRLGDGWRGNGGGADNGRNAAGASEKENDGTGWTQKNGGLLAQPQTLQKARHSHQQARHSHQQPPHSHQLTLRSHQPSPQQQKPDSTNPHENQGHLLSHQPPYPTTELNPEKPQQQQPISSPTNTFMWIYCSGFFSRKRFVFGVLLLTLLLLTGANLFWTEPYSYKAEARRMMTRICIMGMCWCFGGCQKGGTRVEFGYVFA